MLTCRTALVTAASIAAAATAQAPTQEFAYHSGVTALATRADLLPNSPGDLITSASGALFGGVGQTTAAPAGRVNGFRATVQDADGSTAEDFDFVIYASFTTGAPNVTPAGQLLRTATLTTPVLAGPVAWSITTSVGTPADVLPGNGFHYGIGLLIRPGGEGLSVQGSSFGFPGPTAARLGAPQPLWSVLQPTRIPIPDVRWNVTLDVALSTEAPVLVTGADIPGVASPIFGVNGTYPDTNVRGDGLVFSVEDRASSGGTAFLFAGAIIAR